MKNCGRRNVRKHRGIKSDEKYTTLDTYLKFGSLDKMKTTSPYTKENLGISRKGLIVSLGLKTIGKSNKNKNARYAITNVSMKHLSKFIKEFKILPYEGYVRMRPKHEPTDSHFYLSIHLAKCMMRSDA